MNRPPGSMCTGSAGGLGRKGFLSLCVDPVGEIFERVAGSSALHSLRVDVRLRMMGCNDND